MKQNNNKKIFNRKELKPRRKELRSNLTYAEVFFWQQVKDRQLDGRKFRRQTSIGSYIVDFYCPEEKLVIELDGEVHFNEEAIKYDEDRTKYIESLGLKVIRFENNEVLKNTEYVLNEIRNFFKK
ncbi:MAG: endonuclease domain-containing protein [Ignavibacterium album]|uniref:endonuclease domain-containing protein n=1 Tax=Ignavibacterium album TaxID=591197 RepID=UPI0026F0EE98|nr:endonuclease domain-containing protein [Ignavibacterium album]MCX8105677.1 endonuclease domain-containing protein [Ignavibacterium album]